MMGKITDAKEGRLQRYINMAKEQQLERVK